MQDENECHTRVNKIRTKFEESTFGMMLYRKSHEQKFSHEVIGNNDLKKEKSSFLTQFQILVRRSFLTTIRDPLLLKVKFIQVIVTALFIGLVNFQTQISGPTIMNMEGILYNTLITSELPIFLREHCCSRIYSASAYYLAKSVAELPEYIILPFCYAIIVYFMSAKAHPYLAYAGACIFGRDSLALTYMPCFTLPNLVFGGFYISFHSIPIYYQFISHMSWFRFAFEALQVNQWLNYKTIPGCEDSTVKIDNSISNYCPAFSGKGILERRGMGSSEIVIFINLAILFVMLIGFRIIGLLALLLRVRLTK
ncbi:hypothetical protein DINM_005859 [Dirofilaria immitis]|nr:hypothetical protein [Dirofilaria immitis]